MKNDDTNPNSMPDGNPVGRFEDVLLDSDATDSQREAAGQALSTDPAAISRAADRHFAHGLLVSEAEETSIRRERRFRTAMDKVRTEGNGKNVTPMPRFRMIVAASLVIGVGFMLWTYIKGSFDAPPHVPTPPIAQVRPPSFEVVSGEVKREHSGASAWLLTSSGDKSASLRFNGDLAVLGPRSTILVDSVGNSFHLISGAVSLEGQDLAVRQGEFSGVLTGGPVVMSDQNGGTADLYSGTVKAIGGDTLLSAGHSRMNAADKTVPLSVGLLPEWVALGRAEDVFRELNAMCDNKLTQQRESWVSTLRPMLAEPITRTAIVNATKELMAAELTDEETQELMTFIGEMLSVIKSGVEAKGEDYEAKIAELCRNIAQHEREIKPELKEAQANNRREFLKYWRGLSEEERNKMRVLARRMLDSMQGKKKPNGN